MRARYQRGPAWSGAPGAPPGASTRAPGWSWRLIVSIRRAYGAAAPDWRTPVGGAGVLAAVVTVTVAAATRSAVVGVGMALSLCLVPRVRDGRRLVAVLLIVLGAGAGLRSASAWDDLRPDAVGPFEGWARVVDDPQPFGRATRVIIELDGERFELWARGRALQIRVMGWRGGELVQLSGERRELQSDRRDRVAWQHVVGEFRLEWASDVTVGSPVDRASNRVRETIERGAASLPGDDGALFRGLVVGDDRDQPRAMIERFRASGLSHLTAVSGQNVAFVLTAAGPLLAALRPWWRWAVTLALIGWFVSLTRFEPSIVRAGAMAMLSATAFVLGRERSPIRLLGVAVVGLMLIDPLLVRSIGFWLSVGATAGVSTIGPWLAARWSACGPLALPLGVTIGAQIGVVVPAVWVFGRLPLVSVPANLLAVPVAGFVMLYGLPAGLVAGAVPPLAPVVMFPCRVGVRWVDTVAALGERVEPGGAATWIGWMVLAIVGGLTALRRRPAMNQNRHGDPSAHR